MDHLWPFACVPEFRNSKVFCREHADIGNDSALGCVGSYTVSLFLNKQGRQGPGIANSGWKEAPSCCLPCEWAGQGPPWSDLPRLAFIIFPSGWPFQTDVAEVCVERERVREVGSLGRWRPRLPYERPPEVQRGHHGARRAALWGYEADVYFSGFGLPARCVLCCPVTSPVKYANQILASFN